MPLAAGDIEARIKAVLPDADIVIEALAADNDHYKVVVTSAAFAGKTRIEQHRLIHQAMEGTDLHAMMLQTVVKMGA